MKTRQMKIKSVDNNYVHPDGKIGRYLYRNEEVPDAEADEMHYVEMPYGKLGKTIIVGQTNNQYVAQAAARAVNGFVYTGKPLTWTFHYLRHTKSDSFVEIMEIDGKNKNATWSSRTRKAFRAFYKALASLTTESDIESYLVGHNLNGYDGTYTKG